MPAPIPVGAAWRKSSFSGSGGNGDGCVEVAAFPDGEVAVRDTKDRARPSHHSAAAWREFLTGIRAREFEA